MTRNEGFRDRVARVTAVGGFHQLGPAARGYAPALRPARRRPAGHRLGRAPWRQTLNINLMKDIHPFENTRRYFQLRVDAINVLNHATFQTDDTVRELFGTGVPVSRTGLSLAGPIPYLVDRGARDFPVGTRENILAASYRQNFGKLWRTRNGPGRVIQLALRIYF